MVIEKHHSVIPFSQMVIGLNHFVIVQNQMVILTLTLKSDVVPNPNPEC